MNRALKNHRYFIPSLCVSFWAIIYAVYILNFTVNHHWVISWIAMSLKKSDIPIYEFPRLMNNAMAMK